MLPICCSRKSTSLASNPLDRPRLLLVIDALPYGGAEKQFCMLVDRLDRNRYDIHVCVLFSEASNLHRIDVSRGVKLHATGFRKSGNPFVHLARIQRLVRLICRIRPHLVHAWLFYASVTMASALAIANRRTPIVFSMRCAMSWFCLRGWPGRLKAVAAWICQRFLGVTSVQSRALMLELQRWRIPLRNIKIVPNGIDLGPFGLHVQCGTESQLGQGTGLRLITVSNLVPGKGHRFLLEALSLAKKQTDGLSLTVVGDGTLREELESLVEYLGLQDSVCFVGHQENPLCFLQNSDVALCPSFSEGLPNVVLEAMAAGLPVIASDVGGIPDLIKSGRTGLLVPPGDKAGLVDAIETLQDAHLRSSIGRAARAVAERFSTTNMVRQTSRLYEETLQHQGHP